MKDMFKDFNDLCEEFRKMGQDLGNGASDIAEGATSIFDSADNLFKRTSYSYAMNSKSGGEDGVLKTETEHYTLSMPTPGLSPDQIDVHVFANKVRVSTQNFKTSEKTRSDYELPEQIDPKLCLATLHRGILTIKVQKTGIVSSGVKIEVKENS